MSESRKLTIQDPVDPETLSKFNSFASAEAEIAARLLENEKDKLQILRAAHHVDAERRKLFETLLISRGLAPNTEVWIDAKTGVIQVGSEKPEPEKPES